ncbi:MAG: HEAT repeat domain-containing protein, partial [Deltaproteobacteria bacterium]
MTEQDRYEAVAAVDPASAGGLELLWAALGDESWRVRRAAVGRLVAGLEPGDLSARFTAMLADPESVSRRNAAFEALVALGDAALPALVGAADSVDQNVRKLAIDALGEIGSREAERALLQ